MRWNKIEYNAVKKSSCITKGVISYEKIISKLSNLRSDTNTTEESTESVLQRTLVLSVDNLK